MAATAKFGFVEGFSSDGGGLNSGGDYGGFTIGNGLAGADGAYALEIEGGEDPSGPYTKFGSYSDEFVNGSATSVSIYFDPSIPVSNGFQYSVAVNNNTDGVYLSEYGFRASSNGNGTIFLGAGKGLSFEPVAVGDLPTPTVAISKAGWYTLEHVFHDVGGVLSVDMNLIDATGVSQTITTITGPAISQTGGNRYGWFTSIDVPGSGAGSTVGGGLAVDNYTLGDFVGRVVEATGAAPATYTDSGAIPFTDTDNEVHTVSVRPTGSGYLGTFAAQVANDVGTGDQNGAVSWTFDASGAAVDAVAQGQSLVQTYAVTLTGADNLRSTQNVTVTIVGANDAPVITSNGGASTGSVSHAENSSLVTTVTSTDVDNGATRTYSIAGGVDAAKFTISASTGVLQFLSAPDYENPTDNGANNVYDVNVAVSDGMAITTQALAIAVRDVFEAPPSGPGNDVIVIPPGTGSGTYVGGGGSDTISAQPVAGETLSLFGGSSLSDPNDGGDQIVVSGGGASQVYGNGGNDSIDYRAAGAGTVYGGLGADSIGVANDANNLVYGGTVDGDTISVSGAGNNPIYGGSIDNDPGDGGDSITVSGTGLSLIYSNGGNDTVIVTSSGAATVFGGLGADSIDVQNNASNQIFGGTGDGDVIRISGNGNNTIFGGSVFNDPTDGADQITVTGNGNNVIYGNGGDDRILVTGTGSNTIYGGVGSDTITGGSGNDRLEGSVGANVYTGGGGADRFVHGAGATDTITDFSLSGGDRLELGGQVYSLTTGSGGAATLVFADGGAIVLQGVTEAQFSAAFVA